MKTVNKILKYCRKNIASLGTQLRKLQSDSDQWSDDERIEALRLETEISVYKDVVEFIEE